MDDDWDFVVMIKVEVTFIVSCPMIVAWDMTVVTHVGATLKFLLTYVAVSCIIMVLGIIYP